MNDITDYKELFNGLRTIAIVGLSKSPKKDSYGIATYLKRAGFKIIPVNPTADEILGERSYPDLKSIPEKIDVVDVFRPSEDVPPIIDQALETDAKIVWLQTGIMAPSEYEQKVKKAGKILIQDQCLATTHRIYVAS